MLKFKNDEIEIGINEGENLANKASPLFMFKEVKITIYKLLLNLNKTNFVSELDKSILINCNQMNFLFEIKSRKINFDIKEFGGGTIDVKQIINFLNSKQIALYYRSTIIDLFDLNFDINVKDTS